MLKNYIKVALRRLFRNKLDALISIGGLALGIACCILLLLFVHFEWSFDDFHERSDRIYRVVTATEQQDGEESYMASAPWRMGPELEADFPELQEVVRLLKSEVEQEQEGEFVSRQVLFADPGFFEVFGFELRQGNPAAVLGQPDNIVLTESNARRIFGSTDVVGQEVGLRMYEEVRRYRVSGIAADPPPNSSLQFGMLLPAENYFRTVSPLFRKVLPGRWDVTAGEVFILLNPRAGAGQLEAKFEPFVEEHFTENAEEKRLRLQPMEEIYLDPRISSSITESTSPLYSWILAGIAAVVLAIACINFMSLSLSRTTARLNEIGIRKASGAGRSQLAFQFLGEALVTCVIAFLLGILLAELALPYLRQVVSKPVPFLRFAGMDLWMSLGALVLIAGLITGLYPALVMSRKSASDSLRGSRAAQRIPSFVKGLIVAQFALSMIFVSAAFVMHKQINFVLEKDLGFAKENVVVIDPDADTQQMEEIYSVFEQKARNLPGVQNMTATFSSYSGALLYPRLLPEEDRPVEVGLDLADPHFLETLQVELLEGRGFSPERPSDLESGAVVNRAFVDRMGWEEALGREIPRVEVPQLGEGETYLPQSVLEGKRVIGVVENFHYQSLHNELKPLVLVSRRAVGNGLSTIWVRLDAERTSETLASLESAWNGIAPEQPFAYTFLDDALRRQYENERRWRDIVEIASLFAVALACFGLVGLAALTARRRTREIGIRKVFGATVSGIVGLLSWDFVKLVVLGLLLAVPVAYYAMNRWLADFAYRIELGPGIFLLAGAAALLIALASVSWQAVRAALVNPAESLRTE